ncbi:hypothetical protein SeMB42_g05486 [Synchytrium endobioticum]|uniref:Autophagy-related protein n=1 Tax=Synchytrium endobioticum TaxID=286115 RepID=A0A507CWX7_9FUNG|nr:hypothetical protein SeMB42_g05486 [Synchytrium endobioticum]TPX43541.1 hypothetical protein SeLEV6574_g05010 [Synchytrium endobioticum]
MSNHSGDSLLSRESTLEVFSLNRDNANSGSAEDDSETSDREILGWYLFGAAAEPFFSVCSSIFGPLVIQSRARNVAVQTIDYLTPCNVSDPNYSCVVLVGGLRIDPTAFSLYGTVVSVFLQLLVFVTLSAAADYGADRKKLLLMSSVTGLILEYAWLTITRDSQYWIASVLSILGNVAFGVAFVIYLSYLPIMTRNHPSVREAMSRGPMDSGKESVALTVSNKISSKAFVWSYMSAVIVIVLGAGAAMFLGNTIYSLQIAIALGAVWGTIFMFPAFSMLKARPGPPFPENENYWLFGWKRTINTLSKARDLPSLFYMLAVWFCVSDAMGTLGSLAILFASKELNASQATLALLALEVYVFGVFGAIFFTFVQKTFKVSTWRMLFAVQCGCFVVPVWGGLGLVPGSPIGLRTLNEFVIISAWYGFMLSAQQSFSRVLYADMVPVGKESEFFALYEVSDKGSSWIGPLISAAATDLTHNNRYAFLFLIPLMLAGQFFMLRVDPAAAKVEASTILNRPEYKQSSTSNVPIITNSVDGKGPMPVGPTVRITRSALSSTV